MEIVRVAFICTGNSVRSQMAEGFAKSYGVEWLWVESAGLRPSSVSQKAIAVMKEMGIDISGQRSKGLEELSDEIDYLITLCDDASKSCGNIKAKKKRIHWSIEDPYSIVVGSCGDVLEPFRKSRDKIREKVIDFLHREGLYRE